MKRGQITLDFMFGVTLVALTILSLVQIAGSDIGHAEVFSSSTDIKIFSISVRDAIVKVYSSGPGYSFTVTPPIKLRPGENITVILKPIVNKIDVNAYIGGSYYEVVLNSPVPIFKLEEATLTSDNSSLVISAVRSGGEVYVEITTRS